MNNSTNHSKVTKLGSEAAKLPGSSDETNAVHELHSLLSCSFDQIKKEQVDEDTPAGSCLRPLLLALEWSGEDRHLFEALPHFDRVRDIEGLRAVLDALNFDSLRMSLSTAAIKPAMLPCLYCQGENISVVLEINKDGSLLVYDGNQHSFKNIKATRKKALVYLVREADLSDQRSKWADTGWFQMVLGKFKRTFVTLLVLSFGINLLTMAVPLYIMSVYSMAIGSKSFTTLIALFTGICLIVVSEVTMRVIRGRAIAYLGARVESMVSIRVFQHLLYLPISMTESANIATQVTRLKQYESVRDLFTGSLIAAFLDLPFIGLFVLAVFAMGGVLGFVPVALIIIYAILAAITIPLTRKHLRQAGERKTKMRNFLMSTTSKHKTLRDAKAQDVWIKKFGMMASQQLLTQFNAQHFNLSVQTIAQTLMLVAGAATVGIGTVLAMDSALSMGALIGATTMVWRGLAPIQSAFLGLTRLGQSIDSIKQINQLLLIDLERQPGKHATLYRILQGNVSLHGVSMRYTAQSEPSMNNLSLKVKAGEFVAITGDSGAGKSTLLTIIAALRRPQAGIVQIDNIDSRQFDVGELRHEIGYVPQHQSFFYGTISQNIRLAHPSATEDDIKNALYRAGILQSVMALENGLEFRMRGNRETRFSASFLKQLMLARAYVKNAPINLLDEPGAQLDREADEILVNTLRKEKGRSTILMISHRPSHMYLADRVIVLQRGRIVADGPPEKIVPAILAKGKATADKRMAG